MTCRHVCRCGAALRCGDPDKCAAGAFWQCGACDLDDQDAYFSRLELSQREQEHTTDEHQQRIPEQVSQS